GQPSAKEHYIVDFGGRFTGRGRATHPPSSLFSLFFPLQGDNHGTAQGR
ncbi:hypothetical protein A2U01_0087034, partial [Trifolium medium]|nr:hypothetical protein [Trifolium medium]